LSMGADGVIEKIVQRPKALDPQMMERVRGGPESADDGTGEGWPGQQLYPQGFLFYVDLRRGPMFGSLGPFSINCPPLLPPFQMRAEMEAQLRAEVAARNGGTALTEEQLASMRAEAEEKARIEAQRMEEDAAKLKRRQAKMNQEMAKTGEEAEKVCVGGLTSSDSP